MCAADLRACAASLLAPERMLVVVVGDAGRVKAELEAIAPVTVVSEAE